MQPFITPSHTTWLAAAATAAREAQIPLRAILGDNRTRYVCAARWKAWKAILDRNPHYSMAGLARTCGWHHTAILSGIKRLAEGPPPIKPAIKRMDTNKARRMKRSRRLFSDEVMRQSAALDMSIEEFARAVGKPVSLILERAKAAGIEMKQEGFAVARGVPRASIASDRSSVVDMGFRNPFER